MCVHFRGMRSGTVPHVLAVGLGAACEVAQEEMEVNFGQSEYEYKLLKCLLLIVLGICKSRINAKRPIVGYQRKEHNKV